MKVVRTQTSKDGVRHFISLSVGIFYKETLVLFYSLIAYDIVYKGNVEKYLLVNPFHLFTGFQDNGFLSSSEGD